MPEEYLKLLTPDAVTAGALTLCHEDAPNRMILCAGAGGYASTRLFETEGVYLPADQQSPENVLKNMDTIVDTGAQRALQSGGEQSEKFLKMAVKFMASQQ
ncbi:MAG: hypothetical protein HKN70_12350 [Gammaproteobacteria bacterium]|nr:hypothetical protein [Gammaproteobacteria bacterium]